MKTKLIACLAAVALSAVGGTFETDDMFSITLPEGWVAIPDTVLAEYSDSLAVSEEAEEVQWYDYGYQLGETGEWLTYPCILVQVNMMGRYSTGAMERFKASASTDAVSLANKNTLLMEVRERDGVKVLAGRQLTEYGYIELTGFAPADEFDQYADVFRSIFSSLVIDEAIAYKPRLSDNAPVIGSINLGKVLAVCVQGALVGAVLWGVYTLLRRTFRHKLKRA